MSDMFGETVGAPITHFTANFRSGQMFGWGEHRVVYVARDGFGNIAVCQFDVVVAPLSDLEMKSSIVYNTNTRVRVETLFAGPKETRKSLSGVESAVEQTARQLLRSQMPKLDASSEADAFVVDIPEGIYAREKLTISCMDDSMIFVSGIPPFYTSDFMVGIIIIINYF